MTNVMLDLETMGHTPNSALLEIGACVFSSAEGITGEFSTMIDLDSCVRCGMVIDPSTVLWWMRQHWDARKRYLGNNKAPGLPEALKEFQAWIPKGSTVWGNGSDFDNVILTSAYRAIGWSRPWPDFNDRCFRTLKNLYPKVKAPERKGTHHAALDDAKHQALWALKIYEEVLRVQ